MNTDCTNNNNNEINKLITDSLEGFQKSSEDPFMKVKLNIDNSLKLNN